MLRAVSVMFFPHEGKCGKMRNKYPINGALIIPLRIVTMILFILTHYGQRNHILSTQIPLLMDELSFIV